MICWTSRDEPVALGEHPAGEPLDGLRVVGGVGDRLGEQPDRADGGLQLVGDVGDEVAAYRLDPALAGAVLDQGQHQPGARAARRGRSPCRAGRRAAASTSSASRIWPSRRTCRTSSASSARQQSLAADQPEREGRRGGLDHLVARRRPRPRCCAAPRARWRRRRAGRVLGGGDVVLLALAHVPGQHGASGDDGPDERGQKSLRRGAHARIVRRRVTCCSPSGRRAHGVFTTRSPPGPVRSPWPPTVEPHA